jgi:hypothetical protein
MLSERVGRGALLAGVSGLVLLVSLFLPWYGVEAPGLSRSGSAWTELELIDLLLLLIGLAAIGWTAALATDALEPSVPAAALVAVAGLLSSVLILFRIVDLPTPDVPARLAGLLDFELRPGAFVGLAAATGIALGGLFASRRPERGRQ